jgi:hypothetical protein
MRLGVVLSLTLLALGPGPIGWAQQSGVQVEVGAQFSYWRLETGGYDRIGPTATVGVLLPRGTPIGLRVTSSYAPRGELSPGILAVGAQAVVPLLRPATGGSPIGLEGVLGFGGLRYDGTTGRELAIECGAPDCFEGVFFRGGWSQVVEVGLGLEVPLSRAWFVHPSADLHIPLGDTSDGPGQAVLRIGVGMGFR